MWRVANGCVRVRPGMSELAGIKSTPSLCNREENEFELVVKNRKTCSCRGRSCAGKLSVFFLLISGRDSGDCRRVPQPAATTDSIMILLHPIFAEKYSPIRIASYSAETALLTCGKYHVTAGKNCPLSSLAIAPVAPDKILS